MTPKALAVRVGSRWAAVVDYGTEGGTGSRQGCWCEDEHGGWGTGRTPKLAIAGAQKPRLYGTRRAALEAVDPLGEMHDAAAVAGRGWKCTLHPSEPLSNKPASDPKLCCAAYEAALLRSGVR